MSDIMMSYRVDPQVLNIMNGNFNTYREEKETTGEAQAKPYYTINSQKAGPKAIKKGSKVGAKTPNSTKSRKITQKENREMNTTDKASKKKSAFKMHLV